MGSARSVILCGDSILDNGAYVGAGGRPLLQHLHELLPGWQIDFRALDGASCSDVSVTQLGDGGEPAQALVISVGGNDALGHADLLGDPRKLTFLEAGLVLADIQGRFRSDYQSVLEAARGQAERILVLTIYRPRFGLAGMPEAMQRASQTLLSIFNDVIVEEALAHGCGLVDIRAICTSDEHYANPIEPSDFGGREIAGAIAESLSSRST